MEENLKELRKLYPELSDAELIKAGRNLKRYAHAITNIYLRNVWEAAAEHHEEEKSSNP